MNKPVNSSFLNLTIVVILCIFLFVSPAIASSQVKIIPIQDILFLIPDFDNAPDFNLNQGITQSGSFIGSKKPIKLTKEKEKELLELLKEFFPNSKLKIWNGNLVVKS
jgi:hypothetical protein